SGTVPIAASMSTPWAMGSSSLDVCWPLRIVCVRCFSMAARPDIPKRLAARIRGAQERVRQKRLSIVGAEYNYANSTKRLAEFECDPHGFAERYYRGHDVDSYPVQTTIARERERIEYHQRRCEERIRELAELESGLMRVEEQVMVEV